MRLTKFNPETGQYVVIETPKTYSQLMAQRKAVIQKLGKYEDKSTEVAEEIFEEIDKYLEKWISYNKDKKINASFGFDKELYERCEMRIANLERYQKDMSELKKKYTEGGE